MRQRTLSHPKRGPTRVVLVFRLDARVLSGNAVRGLAPRISRNPWASAVRPQRANARVGARFRRALYRVLASRVDIEPATLASDRPLLVSDRSSRPKPRSFLLSPSDRGVVFTIRPGRARYRFSLSRWMAGTWDNCNMRHRCHQPRMAWTQPSRALHLSRVSRLGNGRRSRPSARTNPRAPSQPSPSV